MSGFLVSDINDPTLKKRVLKSLSFSTYSKGVTADVAGLRVVVTRVDRVSLWGPANDPKSGTYAFIGGRLAFEENEWKRAADLPIDGGLACRLLVEGWLEKGEGFIEELNGAFCAVIISPKKWEVTLISDRLGIYPCFVDTRYRGLLVASHPDVLATETSRTGLSSEIDVLSVAESLSTACAGHPNTYYKHIIQLDPATVYRWRRRKQKIQLEKRVYWKPRGEGDSRPEKTEDLAEELSEGLKRSVCLRTHALLGDSAVFLSAGADSRTALFGAERPSEITRFTLYQEPTVELEMARQLAVAAQARHVPLQRDEDYYAIYAEEAVRVSGGVWSIADAHFLSVPELVDVENYGTMITACYADYFLKGLSLNRAYRRLFGRYLPVYKRATFQYQFYYPHAMLRDHWQARLVDRFRERFPQELVDNYDKNPFPIEDIRLRPFASLASESGRLVLWRTLPWDPFIADNSIVKLYGRLSVSQRINAQVFGKAVARVVGADGRHIPNQNYGAPVDASEFRRNVTFVFNSIKRKFGAVRSKIVTSHSKPVGAWPNWSKYIVDSAGIRELWSGPKQQEREFFLDLLGFDPWTLSYRDWGQRDAALFMRLLTVRLWLKQRNQL